MKQFCNIALIATFAAVGLTSAAHALPVPTISAAPGSAFNTSSVTQDLTGAGMAGATVEVCLATSGCETVTWASTSSTAGGAFSSTLVNIPNFGQVPLWSLALDGQTFSSPFILEGAGIISVLVNGQPGLTTFDILPKLNETPVSGSPGSELGRPFEMSAFSLDSGGSESNYAISVQYSNRLFVNGVFYDDLYNVMEISFLNSQGQAPLGFSGTMEFFADTDRTRENNPFVPGTPVPAPATLALVGLGLLGLAASRRKAASRA